MKHSFFFILLILLVSLRVAGQDRIDWDQIKAAPGANYLPKSNVSGDGVWTAIGAILSGANAVYGTGSTGYIAEWLNDSTLTFDANGAYQLSVGTDAQRPTGAAGLTRYNSTNGNFEYYGASAWEYPVKSTSASGLTTSTYVLYGDANGRATGSSALTFAATTTPPLLTVASDIDITYNSISVQEAFKARWNGYGTVVSGGLQFLNRTTNSDTKLWVKSNGTGTTAGFDLQGSNSSNRGYVYYTEGTGILFGTTTSAASSNGAPTIIQGRYGTVANPGGVFTYNAFEVQPSNTYVRNGLYIDPIDSTGLTSANLTMPLFARQRTGQPVMFEFQDSTNAQIYRLKGTGQFRWNRYGSGTFAGTPVYLLGVNSSKDVVEYAFSSLYTGWTLAGTSGTPQSIGSGQTATIAAGAGMTTTAGATRTVTVAADTAGVIASKAWASARSWTLAGDSGTGQAINWGNTASILGGYGINTVASATDVLTITADTLTELATQYDVAQGWLGPRLVAGTVNIDVLSATNSDLVIDTLNDLAIRGDGQFALKKLNGSGWFEIESENDSLNILADGVGIVSDSTIRMATKYLQANGVSLWRAAPGSAPYSEPAGTYLWTVDENGQNGAWADAGALGTWLKPELEAGNVSINSGSNTLTFADGSITNVITAAYNEMTSGTKYGYLEPAYFLMLDNQGSGITSNMEMAMTNGDSYLLWSDRTAVKNSQFQVYLTSSSSLVSEWRYLKIDTASTPTDPAVMAFISVDKDETKGSTLLLSSPLNTGSTLTSAANWGYPTSGAQLGAIVFAGKLTTTGTEEQGLTKSSAIIYSSSTQTQSVSAHGGKIVFGTTLNGSTSPTDRLTIDQDGSLYSTGSAAHDVTFDDVDGFSVNTNDQWLNAGDGYGGIEGTYTNSPRTYKYGLANTLDGQGYSYLYSQRQSGTGGDWAFGIDSSGVWFGTNYSAQLYQLPNTQPDVSSGQQSIMQQDGNGSTAQASWKKVASGITTGTTDGSGDLSVTCVMDDTSYLVTATAEGTTFYTLTAHTKGTTSFKVRVFDAAGAAVTSTSVTVGWWAIDQ